MFLQNHRAIKLDECSEERLLTTIIEKNSNEPLGMQIEVIGDAVNVNFYQVYAINEIHWTLMLLGP